MAKQSKKRTAEEAVGDAEDPRAKADEEEHNDGGEAEDDVSATVEEEQSEAALGGEEADEEMEEGDAAAAEEDAADDNEEEAENGNEEEEAVDGNDNEEEKEQEETGSNDEERPESKFKRHNVQGKPAEAGIIKHIYCENFMCHRKLSVNLCRNVNFINGQNGSGKSAILASIQICLGANARRTHRARCLKELVRKEAAGNNPNTSAKIRVTLLNGGDDAYKPEDYGKEITVERSISLRGGYNGYRLLDEDGKEVSREKKELDAMLDHLNIQVDNPVAILDQEEAKKFLLGKATDKYNFFMKATELERIDKKYAETCDKTQDLKVKQERVVSQLEEKAAMVTELKKKYELHTSVQELEKKVLEQHANYGWAFYAERDAEYQDFLAKKQAFQQKIDAKQLELTQAEERASGATDDDEEQRIKEEMEELQKEAALGSSSKISLENEVKQAKVPCKAKERDLKSVKQEKKRAQNELAKARKRLDDTRAEIRAKAGSAESEEARRQALLSETEQALGQAREQSNELKQAQNTAHRDYEELGPEVEQAKSNSATKASHLNAAKRKLADLKSSSAGDSLAIFGERCTQMHKLVEDAKKRNRFQGEVLGPIGAYIKVAPGKEQYVELAEKALGGNNLDRFIVTNDKDRKVFQGLREQAKCWGKQCGLYQVTVSPRYNIPPPPAEGIETVASALVISNDIVFNCLVDNGNIDRRALAPSKEESERSLLSSDNNGRYSIKGIINEVFFLPSGDKWTVRDGSISIVSNEQERRGRRIGVDRTAAIAESEREVADLDGEVKELRKAEHELVGRHKDLQRKWNTDKRAYRQNQEKIEELSSKVEEIRTEQETTANTTIDTTDLEEDVSNAEEEVARLDVQESKFQKELEELLPAVADAETRLEEVKTRNEKILVDMNAAGEKLTATQSRQEQAEKEVEKKRSKLEKAVEIMTKHTERVDEKDNERMAALQKAKKLYIKYKVKSEQGAADGDTQLNHDPDEEDLHQVEIQEVGKASDYYHAKVNKLKAKIVKEKEKKALSNEDPAAALQKWQNAKKNLEDCQQQAEDLKNVIRTLEADLHERKRRWAKLRQYLSRSTDNKFDEILMIKGSTGNIDFDNENFELNLCVQKDMHDESSQTKDVKSLSGGERSYTTMSLLLALGEALETPFRILDEFDVFLDTQTRKLTIKTLIHLATSKKMLHRQFIFITPQDLSSVTPDDQVRIFKLNPPERNNVAGGATQQTLNLSQSS